MIPSISYYNRSALHLVLLERHAPKLYRAPRIYASAAEHVAHDWLENSSHMRAFQHPQFLQFLSLHDFQHRCRTAVQTMSRGCGSIFVSGNAGSYVTPRCPGLCFYPIRHKRCAWLLLQLWSRSRGKNYSREILPPNSI